MENVITLGKLIGLLLLFCLPPPPPSPPLKTPTSKLTYNNTRNELAHPVMGTIFLVY